MSQHVPGQGNSATIIIGNSGTGKSSLGATLAEYLWETFQKVLLYYSSDGGGIPSRVQALQRLGILRLFRMRSRGNPFETSLLSTRGWFPAQVNGSTGEVTPGMRMIPPLTEEISVYCPEQHLLKVVRHQAQIPAVSTCPICKKQVMKSAVLTSRITTQTKGFESVGGVFFDGLSSMLSWMMLDMAGRTGRLELKGEESALGGRIIDGDMALGGNNRSHYGFAQTRAEEMATNALSIPNLVVPPVFTALLLEATDKGGLQVKGPKLAGEAKTAESPQWFGNCLESTVVQTDKGEKVFRLQLDEYIDDQGARHLVKHRGAPGSLPPYLEDAPGEAPFNQFNLGVFFRLLEEGTRSTEQEMRERFPNAPGVAETLTMGDGPDATVKADAPKAAVARPAAPTLARGTKPKPVVKGKTSEAPAPAEPVPAPSEETPVSESDSLPPVAETTQEPTVDEAGTEVTASPKPAPEAPAPAPAPRPAPRPAASVASPRPAPGVAGRAFAPPPMPRPPASAPKPPAPRVPGLLPRKP